MCVIMMFFVRKRKIDGESNVIHDYDAIYDVIALPDATTYETIHHKTVEMSNNEAYLKFKEMELDDKL